MARKDSKYTSDEAFWREFTEKKKEMEMASKDSKHTSDEAFGREPKINTPQAQQKAIADSKSLTSGKKGK